MTATDGRVVWRGKKKNSSLPTYYGKSLRVQLVMSVKRERGSCLRRLIIEKGGYTVVVQSGHSKNNNNAQFRLLPLFFFFLSKSPRREICPADSIPVVSVCHGMTPRPFFFFFFFFFGFCRAYVYRTWMGVVIMCKGSPIRHRARFPT